MQGPCTICLTKKERDLRGLLAILKERDESVSAYFSLALQYFMEQNKYLYVGTVVPAEDDEKCFISLYLDEEISDMLSKYMERYHIKNRSKFIKTVLSMSIRIGTEREEEIIPEFELRRSIYDNPAVPVSPVRVVQTVKAEEEKPAKEERQEKKDAKPVPMSYSHLEDMEDDPEEVEEEPDLLDNLFANIGSQMNKW